MPRGSSGTPSPRDNMGKYAFRTAGEVQGKIPAGALFAPTTHPATGKWRVGEGIRGTVSRVGGIILGEGRDCRRAKRSEIPNREGDPGHFPEGLTGGDRAIFKVRSTLSLSEAEQKASLMEFENTDKQIYRLTGNDDGASEAHVKHVTKAVQGRRSANGPCFNCGRQGHVQPRK